MGSAAAAGIRVFVMAPNIGPVTIHSRYRVVSGIQVRLRYTLYRYRYTGPVYIVCSGAVYRSGIPSTQWCPLQVRYKLRSGAGYRSGIHNSTGAGIIALCPNHDPHEYGSKQLTDPAPLSDKRTQLSLLSSDQLSSFAALREQRAGEFSGIGESWTAWTVSTCEASSHTVKYLPVLTV